MHCRLQIVPLRLAIDNPMTNARKRKIHFDACFQIARIYVDLLAFVIDIVANYAVLLGATKVLLVDANVLNMAAGHDVSGRIV